MNHPATVARHFLQILLALAFGSTGGSAQWSHDPYVNNPVSTANLSQYLPTVVSDGAGGAIIAWYDSRDGLSYDIYAQRVDSAGVARWTVDGVAVCTATGNQTVPRAVSDGSGGVIIAWLDPRSGNTDIYAQRLNANGIPQWTANGVPIVAAANEQLDHEIATDGAGGAIVCWRDLRSGADYDIYAQRISGSGTVQWTTNGIAVCAAGNLQQDPDISPDGKGGALITWEDFRNGADFNNYSQRVNSSGLVQWTVNGVATLTGANSQINPVVTDDGTGGAIVACQDFRSGSTYDIYAQRIDSTGAILWGPGAAISVAAGVQVFPEIVRTGPKTVVIAWVDNRSGIGYDIYAQSVNTVGVKGWTYDGVPICTATGDQVTTALAPDGSGGVFLVWEDPRSGSTYDLYAQRVNAAGLTQWGTNGIVVSNAPANQSTPAIVPTADGGFIASWHDTREVYADVYAQRVDRHGYLGFNAPVLTMVRDVAGDQGGKVTVAWDRSDIDRTGHTTVMEYSVWRGIEPVELPPGAVPVGPGEPSGGSGTGKYREILTPSGSTYWERVGTVPAHYLAGYSFTAPTLSDSTGAGTPWVKFLVSAATWNPYVFWDSNVDSGYSVDNLSPSSATGVTATVTAGPSVSVRWKANTSDPDVKLYEVHRSLVSGFTPDGATKIGQTADTAFADGTPSVGSLNYYRVVTVDLRDNRSVPSAEAAAAVGSTTVYAVEDKWNMVSVPLTLGDYAKTSVYPTAVSNAFRFAGMYESTPVLSNGVGYWVKFDGAQGVPMTGLSRETDTFTVAQGWNMVGSVSVPVEVSTIGSEPPGLVTSNFFAYEPGVGYASTTRITPGRAYWVKMTGPGKLIVDGTGAAPSARRIRIVPDGDLPPPPPGEELLSARPGSYRLEQNYPNPFNPATELRYALPEEGRVRLVVFNALGQEVAVVAEGVLPAGEHTATFDASALPSGVYLARLEAGGLRLTVRMLLVR